MRRDTRIHYYVCGVAAAAVAMGAVVWQLRLPFPGWWPLATFVFVASLLESVNTRLRLAAKGSTSFIMHIAAALLFGGWWGALIAAVATLIGELIRQNPPIKIVFNISQRILSVSTASLVYQALGGRLPPTYLESMQFSSETVQRDLGVFFVFAAIYFLVNASAVNTAVFLSSGRSFREVWNLNTRGVLGYDLSASVVSVLVAYLYTTFDSWLGFGSLGLIVVIVPIVAVRQVYGLYHQLEDSGQEYYRSW